MGSSSRRGKVYRTTPAMDEALHRSPIEETDNRSGFAVPTAEAMKRCRTELAEPDVVDGRDILELAKQGRAFPCFLSDGEAFGLAAALSDGPLDPEKGWDERFNYVGNAAEWLLDNDCDAFVVLEDVVRMLVAGRLRSSALPRVRTRGRPRRPERNLDDITSRLLELKRDDEARKYIRQSVSAALEETPDTRKDRAKGNRVSTDEELERRRAAYFMLRQELDLVALGLRIPPLANVLLAMLDETPGCDREVLAKAAHQAGVSKSGDRKNLADRLGATRKELRELDARAKGRANLVRESAWWPRQESANADDESSTTIVETPRALSH